MFNLEKYYYVLYILILRASVCFFLYDLWRIEVFYKFLIICFFILYKKFFNLGLLLNYLGKIV